MNIGKGRCYQVAIGAVFLLFGILAVNVQGVSAKEAILVVPDAVLGNVVGTQEVLSSLATEVGKQANFEMSVFAYNPDDDLEVVLGKMAQKVNDLKISTGDTQVSVLGYGIGGLLVRNYLESGSYANDVERVVFVGTPHKGSLVYVPMLWGQNLANQNAWERLYWNGRTDMPILLKQFLPTNPTLAGGVSLDETRMSPLKNALAESRMADLTAKESEAGSPIKTLPITNIRSVGDYDVWYYTLVSVGTNVSSNFSTDSFQYLADGIGVNSKKRIGDGYYNYDNTSWGSGVSKDSLASHEELIHHKISDVVEGLGMSVVGVGQYHNGLAWYEYQGGPYPKKYYAVGFEVNTGEKLAIDKWEMGELAANVFVKVGKTEVGNRILNFASQNDAQTGFRGNPQVVLRSYADQTAKIQSTIFNWQGGRDIREDSFGVVTNEEVVLEMNLWPYCSGVSCSFNTTDGRNIWKIKSRQPIVVEPITPDPIILVHGILGGWNPEMFGLDGETFSILGKDIQQFEGSDWIELNQDKNWSKIRGSLAPNQEYFQFFYDWRNPNSISAEKLQAYIQKVKLETGNSKVDIVAHSMGGLVTRSYLQSLEYGDDVDQVVFAGTPNYGSTDSIPKWRYGDMSMSGGGNFIQDIQDLGVRSFLNWALTEWHPTKDKGLDDQDRLNVIQGKFTGVQGIYSLEELLPTYPSLKVFYTNIYINLDNPLLSKLNSNLASLYNHDIMFVVGNRDDSTPREYHIKPNEPDAPTLLGFKEFVGGDGTVLTESVVLPCQDGTNLDTNRKSCESTQGKTWTRKDVIGDQSSHNGLPFQACKDILDFFGHDETKCDTQPYATETIQPIEYPLGATDLISFSVASPVDLKVTTPTGKVFDKNQTDEYFKSNGAVYLSLGDTKKKIIMLPAIEEGDYDIDLTGVANGGSYDVITWYTDEEKTQDFATSGTIQPNQEVEYKVNVTKDEAGEIVAENLTPTLPNTPPIAKLDKNQYNGYVGDEIVFDASQSSDLDQDRLQYRWDWDNDGVWDTEYSNNAVLKYIYTNLYVGKLKLEVFDGEISTFLEVDVEMKEVAEKTQREQLVQELKNLTNLDIIDKVKSLTIANLLSQTTNAKYWVDSETIKTQYTKVVDIYDNTMAGLITLWQRQEVKYDGTKLEVLFDIDDRLNVILNKILNLIK